MSGTVRLLPTDEGAELTTLALELAARRSAARLSLAQLACRVHAERSYLHRVETGARWPSGAVVEQLDRALNAHGRLMELWEEGDAEREKERQNARAVRVSVRYSVELDGLLAAVPVSDAVTAAEKAVADLAVEYLATPAGPMLTAALNARTAVSTELRRAPSTAQRRDLIRTAGYLSGVLAYAALDLGYSDAAADHARTAWSCAESAGGRELQAWVRGTQSLICRFEQDYPMALALAEDGLRFAGRGTAAPRLSAAVAQSSACVGDRDLAFRALSRADIGTVDTDSYSGLFTFSRAKLAYYGGSALMWLSNPVDLRRAAESAKSAIQQWQSGDPMQRSLDDEALAHVYAATSYIRLGDLDTAEAMLGPVLALPQERRISWLRKRVHEVADLLDGRRYARSSTAAELCGAVRAF